MAVTHVFCNLRTDQAPASLTSAVASLGPAVTPITQSCPRQLQPKIIPHRRLQYPRFVVKMNARLLARTLRPASQLARVQVVSPVTRIAGVRAMSGSHAHENESFETFSTRYEQFFSQVQDLFELQRGLNNCFAYDLVPSELRVVLGHDLARLEQELITGLVLDGMSGLFHYAYTRAIIYTDIFYSFRPLCYRGCSSCRSPRR